jgi:hypothetical protein
MSRSEQRIEWENRIKVFKASGLNATAWCKLHDLKLHQFNYYLYKDKPLKQSWTSPCSSCWLLGSRETQI